MEHKVQRPVFFRHFFVNQNLVHLLKVYLSDYLVSDSCYLRKTAGRPFKAIGASLERGDAHNAGGLIPPR